MPNRALVIFDGDDTLWRTQELYDAAKAQFAALLKASGFACDDPIAKLDAIDARAAERRGFTVERFTDSMLQTYRWLSFSENRHADQTTETHIRKLADPLLANYELYEDAIPVLERLAEEHVLVLATKGEAELQKRKIASLGIERWFEFVRILHRKTELEYKQILDDAGYVAANAWSVGNSIKSDINPALRIGMGAVWIARSTWLYEEGDLITGRVFEVQSLTEAADVILASSGLRPSKPTGKRTGVKARP